MPLTLSILFLWMSNYYYSFPFIFRLRRVWCFFAIHYRPGSGTFSWASVVPYNHYYSQVFVFCYFVCISEWVCERCRYVITLRLSQVKASTLVQGQFNFFYFYQCISFLILESRVWCMTYGWVHLLARLVTRWLDINHCLDIASSRSVGINQFLRHVRIHVMKK